MRLKLQPEGSVLDLITLDSKTLNRQNGLRIHAMGIESSCVISS